MRLLLRWLFNGLCLVSLLACGGTAWLWWRSYHAPAADWLSWEDHEPWGRALRRLSFRMCHGGFQLEEYRLRFKRPRPEPEHSEWLRGQRGLHLTHPEFCALPEWSGEASERWDAAVNEWSVGWHGGWPDLLGGPPPVKFHADRLEDRSYRNTWHGVVLPYRLAACLFALPPFLWLASRSRRPYARRRRTLGLCIRCGYDLTGNTTGRCSECGEQMKTEREVMA